MTNILFTCRPISRDDSLNSSQAGPKKISGKDRDIEARQSATHGTAASDDLRSPSAKRAKLSETSGRLSAVFTHS